jgi:hypothetical protein
MRWSPTLMSSERAIKNYFHACPTALMVLSIHTHTNTYTPFKRFYYTAKKNNNNSKRKKNIDRTSLVDKLD